MRFFSRKVSSMRTAFVMLCAAGCAGTAVGAVGAETERSGWYFSAGTGIALSSGMDQVGWNRDTVCYPTDACFAADLVPAIPGYRWSYDIDADAGFGLEIAFGRQFGRVRLEVAAAQTGNDIEQNFTGIKYLDGRREVPGEGPVVSDSETSIDDVTTRILSLDVYRDFPAANRALTPYIGAGLGVAFVEVGGVRFSSNYRDTSPVPPVYDPPLSFYNSSQDENLSDTVPVWRLHAGADYEVNDRIQLGAKLTYSLVEDIAATGTYSRHPMHAQDPGFINRNTFDAARGWLLAVTLKRRLGR